MDRKFNFGKYKGRDYKWVILTHIGYIMWCFENIPSFALNTEEQALYDAVAISIKKYNLQMSFPVDKMYSHISDKKSFENLETPIIIREDGLISIRTKQPLYNSIEKYRINPSFDLGDLGNEVSKFLDLDIYEYNLADDMDF